MNLFVPFFRRIPSVRRRAPTLSDLEIHQNIIQICLNVSAAHFYLEFLRSFFLPKDNLFFVRVYGNNFFIAVGEAPVAMNIFRGCRSGSL